MSRYSVWEAAGRPITPAMPIREIVSKLRAVFPESASQFGWYADAAHYQAAIPQDHTPYSVDGWPLPNPPWYVCATDVMVSAVGGVAQADALFRYWLAEARAGRTPWLKYLIWQATIYDVRHGWAAQPSADHFDHIHLSTRTDWLTRSIGTWPITPPPPPTRKADTMVVFAKNSSFDFFRCDGQLCTPVPDNQLAAQTYWYAIGQGNNAPVGPVAGLVGGIYHEARPTGKKVDGKDILTHVDIYDMGFFGGAH